MLAKTLEAGPLSTEIQTSVLSKIITQTSDENTKKSDTHKGCKNRRNIRKSSVTGALPGDMGDTVASSAVGRPWKMERTRKNKMKRGTNDREERVRPTGATQMLPRMQTGHGCVAAIMHHSYIT